MSAKTIFEMTLGELRALCEERGMESACSKNDLLIVLEADLRNARLDPYTMMFTVGRRSARGPISPPSDQYIEDDFDANLVNAIVGRIGDVLSGSRQCSRRGSPVWCGRGSVAGAPPVAPRNSLQSVRDGMADVSAQVHREVEAFGVDYRLNTVELALSEIRGALRAIEVRQDAIDERLNSGACGFCGTGRNRRQAAGSGQGMPDRQSTARERELHARLTGIEDEVRRSSYLVRRAARGRTARFEPDDLGSGRSSESENDREIGDFFVSGCDRTERAEARVPPVYTRGVGSPSDDARGDLVSSTRVGAGAPPRVPPRRCNRTTEAVDGGPSVRFDARQTDATPTSRWSAGYTSGPAQTSSGSLYNFKLSPSRFTGGRYEDPTRFLLDSEGAFRDAGVPESEWVKLIGNQFSGGAASWFGTIASLGLSWTEFCAEFADRWDSPELRSRLTAELMSTRQRPDESLTDFCMYKLNLVRRVGLCLPDLDVVNVIVGLADGKFGALLRLNNPRSFVDLRRVARCIDGPRDEHGGVKEKATTKVQAEGRGDAQRGSQPGKQAVVACYGCGGPHYANVCPKRGKPKSDILSGFNKNSGNEKGGRKSENPPRK